MIARLLVTKKCLRDCSYCNKQEIVKQAKVIKDLKGLDNHEAICLTGGEPLLFPERTLSVLEELKGRKPDRPIYLYTATYRQEITKMIRYLEGINYTIHEKTSWMDIDLFETFQGFIADELHKRISCRLMIHQGAEKLIKIRPWAWREIKLKPWIDECLLSDKEELFILSPERYEQDGEVK